MEIKIKGFNTFLSCLREQVLQGEVSTVIMGILVALGGENSNFLCDLCVKLHNSADLSEYWI